jgi:hypothetical protein
MAGSQSGRPASNKSSHAKKEYAARISDEMWGKYKEEITSKFINDGYKLEELRAYMVTTFGFKAR